MKRAPVKKLFRGVSYTVSKDEEGLWRVFIDEDNAKASPGWTLNRTKYLWEAIQLVEEAIAREVPDAPDDHRRTELRQFGAIERFLNTVENWDKLCPDCQAIIMGEEEA